MEFRILGPLEVRDRGASVEIRRQKPRALLAVLILRAREPVTRDALIDALWGEDAPRTARAALQNYVAQLRRALGPGVVESQAGGYMLDAGPEQIDLGRFERLIAQARDAEGEERTTKLREALALWRGPPLADLAYEPFAAQAIARLEELRATAVEDLAEAELRTGAGPELVPELERLIAEHPFRERLRGQLMLALYRSGRQADALEAYQQTRRTLVEELGIEPSAPLRELEQAILRQDPALGAPYARRAREKTPQRSEDRRKKVTVLFVDIDLPDLDPELLHDASVHAMAAMRRVLEEHGATVEQRAGGEVMAIFGIPRAHEDDALRAARAALELEAELTRLADVLERKRRGPIDVRIAIETGEVLAGVDETGHGFASGAAIASAKRTLQRARPGEILAGPGTVRLLGEAAVLAPPSDGRNHASRVVELREDVPALGRRLDVPLVDREAELATLREAFHDAVDKRRCRLFLMLGEPGIGKTRLARELTCELGRIATVLVGRCVSYGKGPTFLPLAEIVRQVSEQRGLREVLEGDEYAELIARRLSHLTGANEAPGSGGETFWAVRRLFESLARERPLVVLFEDLHWAEPTLLDLIEYLAARVSSAPVLLLGLARPELVEERAEWRDRQAARLEPLSGADSRALIENLAAVHVSLRTQILRTAGGNPLFIEQLLAHAIESAESETLPPSLEALLASRLDRLEPTELSVLQCAALVGREFSREAVAQLLLGDDTDLDAAFASAVGKGFIDAARPGEGGQRFRFHHLLIRDAAYATLPKARRAELHERFGRWLEDVEPRSDEVIGYHLEQAHWYVTEIRPADAAAARLGLAAGERLAAAGIRAAKIRDVHAAANLLERACSLLAHEEVVRRDLLIELGLVYWSAGDLRAVEDVLATALDAAVAAKDRRAELRARIELAYLTLFRAPERGTQELLSLTTAAIPLLEEAGDDRTLGVIWDIVAHVRGGFLCRYAESAEAAARAIRHFRRAQWPLTACLQEVAASLYYGPVPTDAALSRCGALLEDADRGGEAHVLVFQAGLLAIGGDFDAARSLASLARTTYEELDWTDKIWSNHAPISADIELLAGNYAEAERLLTDSCRRLQGWGEQARLATQGAQLGEALYRQAAFGQASHWAAIAEECAATDDLSGQFSWRALRSKLLAREGAVEQAELLAREAVEIAARTDAVTQHAHVLLDAAEVASLGGRPEASIEAVKTAARLLKRKGNVASLDRARSMLAELTRV